MTTGHPVPLRVLVLIEDADVIRTLEHVVRDEGDQLVPATSVEEATRLATESAVDVAFVELRVEGGAALALCHHLPTISPGVRVQVVLHPREIDRVPEALALGASGVLVAPTTGEATARVLSDYKAERLRKTEVTTLEARLSRERKRLETYDRLIRFARGAQPSDAVRAIVDGVSQLSAAQGVALYATFGNDESDRVLLASVGTALDLPSTCPPADLSRIVQARSARVVPLITAAGAIVLRGSTERPLGGPLRPAPRARRSPDSRARILRPTTWAPRPFVSGKKRSRSPSSRPQSASVARTTSAISRVASSRRFGRSPGMLMARRLPRRPWR